MRLFKENDMANGAVAGLSGGNFKDFPNESAQKKRHEIRRALTKGLELNDDGVLKPLLGSQG